MHLHMNDIEDSAVSQPRPNARWIDNLSDEDLAFLKRLLLASGSLKELAGAYGISYPTVRLRLDRLIEKVRILDDQQPMDTFERLARVCCAEGRFDHDTLNRLLAAHAQQANMQE